MLRTRVKWYGAVAALVFAALAALAVCVLVVTGPAVRDVRAGDAFSASKRLYDAYDAYDTAGRYLLQRGAVYGEKFPNLGWFGLGAKVWEKTLDVYARTESAADAGGIASEVFDSSVLKSGKLGFTNTYLEAKTAFDQVTSAFSDMMSGYEEAARGDIPYDDFIGELELMAAGKNVYHAAYVEYYKATLMQYVYPEELEKSLPMLEKMTELLPEEYPLYMQTLAALAVSSGDWDRFLEESDKLISLNLNNIKAYQGKAEALIALERFDEAAEACEELNTYNPGCPAYYAAMIKLKIKSGDTQGARQFYDGGETAMATAQNVFSQYLAQSKDISRADRSVFFQSIDFVIAKTAFLMLMDDDWSLAYDMMYNDAFYPAYYYAYLTGDRSLLAQRLIDLTYICAIGSNNEEGLEELKSLAQASGAVTLFEKGELTAEEIIIDGKGGLF
ncbi:MAG: hypothetical protein FWF05_01465 [Oscillospiraceae bacterium]|nr:hypothetical protein [Oscillospiraceae bacterium]